MERFTTLNAACFNTIQKPTGVTGVELWLLIDFRAQWQYCHLQASFAYCLRFKRVSLSLDFSTFSTLITISEVGARLKPVRARKGDELFRMTAMRVRIVLLLSLCFVGIPAHSRSCTQANCTCLETELEAPLKDENPPNLTFGHGSKYFSNAHNISRALYPPRRASAKFILIKVKLYNASSNRINISKYIWTLSCIYTVLPRNLLAAVSLGTLYHEREVLEVTVPEFCTDVPGEKYMQYALSSVSSKYYVCRRLHKL